MVKKKSAVRINGFQRPYSDLQVGLCLLFPEDIGLFHTPKPFYLVRVPLDRDVGDLPVVSSRILRPRFARFNWRRLSVGLLLGGSVLPPSPLGRARSLQRDRY